MRLATTDYTKTVDVGTGTIWFSLYSTVMIRLDTSIKQTNSEAIKFLRDGECSEDKTLATAKQLKMISSALNEIEPDKAVFDMTHLDRPAPWIKHISKDITSCTNLYKTADGKDLLSEVIYLLEYASKTKNSIIVG